MQELFQGLVKKLGTLKDAGQYTAARRLLLYLGALVRQESIRSLLEPQVFSFLETHAIPLLEAADITLDFLTEYCDIIRHAAHDCGFDKLSSEMTRIRNSSDKKNSILPASLVNKTYQNFVEKIPVLVESYEEKLKLFNLQLIDWVIEHWHDHAIMPKNSVELTTLQHQHLQAMIQPYLITHFLESAHQKSLPGDKTIEYALALWTLQSKKKTWRGVLLLPGLFFLLREKLKFPDNPTDNQTANQIVRIQSIYHLVSLFLWTLSPAYADFVLEGTNILAFHCFEFLSPDEITLCCEKLVLSQHTPKLG